MIRLGSGSFALGFPGNTVCIGCYKKEGLVKYLADIKLGRATATAAITLVSFAFLWLLVAAVYALR